LYTYFAVAAPGLETFTTQELLGLGFENPSIEPGGITFRGDLADLYRANLHLRTASRILVRLGNFFHATAFPELEERASHLPWERFLVPGQPVCLRVTCHHSKLYHSGAVGRSVSAALARRLGQASPVVKADEEADQPAQIVVVRLADDRVTVSIDSSGRILHKRGYRQAVAKAPLRETLAAAMVMASGWDRISPLLDPFCGSGAIPIEAAMLALNIPPGGDRPFAFMNWPGFNPADWDSIRGAALPPPTTARRIPILQASDRDAGAIGMSRANAERAGVLEYIEFSCQAISSITPVAGRGWVVTNPPYGQRVSEGSDLRNLYARFGTVLRDKCPGWRLSVLSSDPILVGQLGMELDTSLAMHNGGIAVRLARGQV